MALAILLIYTDTESGRRMRKHRTLLILLIFSIAAAAFLVIYPRWYRPPRATLLLPEGELIFFVNLHGAHWFFLGGNSPPLKFSPSDRAPGYQDFVRQTGFQLERDLEEVAMSRQNLGSGTETESSEVFVGSFDRDRLKNYLEKIADRKEVYADQAIFFIRHQGHTVRACVLGADTVAVTNMQSSGPMHGIVDKFRNSSPPAGGPSLIQGYYRYVPRFSMAWLIFHTQGNGAQLPGGLSFEFLENKTAVASLRYQGSLLLKAEVFTDSETAARQLTESAATYLALSRSIAQSLGTKGTDRNVKEAFDSIRIEQIGERSVLTTTISPGFLKKIWSENSITIE